METTINERFVKLIEMLKMNPNSFAKSVGKSYTAIESITKGKTRPSFDVLEAVFTTYPDVNTDWLLSGRGVALRSQEVANSESTLADYLMKLEDQFSELIKQLNVKDNQLQSKDTQIAGLQRTVDALLVGKRNGVSRHPNKAPHVGINRGSMLFSEVPAFEIN